MLGKKILIIATWLKLVTIHRKCNATETKEKSIEITFSYASVEIKLVPSQEINWSCLPDKFIRGAVDYRNLLTRKNVEIVPVNEQSQILIQKNTRKVHKEYS